MAIRQQMRRRDEDDLDSRIDWGIIFSVLVLAVIGMVSIYVAVQHDTSTTSLFKTMLSQGLWYVIGGIAVYFVMQFDAEQLWKIAPVAYAVGMFLMVAVLIFYSRSLAAANGAKSWFLIPVVNLSFQPSEVMKPAFILMMGRVITKHNSENFEHTVKSDMQLLGKMIAWLIPIALSLKLQNDLGTMLVFFAILGGMLLVSGLTWKIIVPVFSFVAVVGGSLLYMAVYARGILLKIGFHEYQFKRIDTWLNPSSNANGSSYQVYQSIRAIASGQILGKGFNVSNVSVPVRESDMIFSVVGENFGFIGGCVLIFMYFLLIYQMLRVTFDTKNEFYAYVSTGVIMMILFHVFENIGMSIGLLPMTGIPLPFISQGGSSLIGNMLGIGMIMSMRFHYHSYMFSTGGDFH